MPYKNINPTIWGPHLWKFMHYLTLSYPENPTEEEKDTLYNFFHTIKTVLPCEKCRYNFNSHLEKTPLSDEILSNNANVIRWLFDIHNEVNKSNNKPELPYDEFIKIYSKKEENLEKKLVNLEKEVVNLEKEVVVKPFIQKVPEDTKSNGKSRVEKVVKNNKIVEYLKNNKIVLGLLIIILIIIVIYLNKKF
jgi:hypothetical protein